MTMQLTSNQREVIRQYLLQKQRSNKRIPYLKLASKRPFTRYSVEDLKTLFRNELKTMEDEARRKQIVAMKREKKALQQQAHREKMEQMEEEKKDHEEAKEALKIAKRREEELTSKLEETTRILTDEALESARKAKEELKLKAMELELAKANKVDADFVKILKLALANRENEIAKLKKLNEDERVKMNKIDTQRAHQDQNLREAEEQLQKSQEDQKVLKTQLEFYYDHYFRLKDRRAETLRDIVTVDGHSIDELYDILDKYRSYRLATEVECDITKVASQIVNYDASDLKMVEKRRIITDEILRLQNQGLEINLRAESVNESIRTWWETRCQFVHGSKHVNEINHAKFQVIGKDLKGILENLKGTANLALQERPWEDSAW